MDVNETHKHHNSSLMQLLRLNHIALLLVIVVIGLGALTRLLDAGLGCPDWPGCYGFLTPPEQAHHIEQAEQLFPETPVVRHQAWMEMIHRYAASFLGIIVFAITWLTLKHKAIRPNTKTVACVLSAVVIVQAIFGMWTVTWKLWPPIVTLHLLGGFTTLGLLIWLRMALYAETRLTDQDTQSSSSKHLISLKRMSLATLIVLIIQISLGAWTSSNYAGLACPDFPTCQGQWFNHVSVEKALSIPTYDDLSFLHGRTDAQTRVSIQVVHRVGALITVVMMALMILQIWKSPLPQRKGISLLLGSLLITQVSLGVLSAVWLLPLSIALAHNLVAAMLLGSHLLSMFHIFNSAQTDKQTVRETKQLINGQEQQDGDFIPNNS